METQSVVVTLRGPGLPEPADLELPGEVAVGEWLPALVEALGLPAGEYGLFYQASCLADEETLVGAGVLAGSTVTLRPLAAEAEGERPHAQKEQHTPVRLTDLVSARVAASGPERSGKVVSFWSGPAGGTGRTTLALALAGLMAERGTDVALLALAEPSISAVLCLPRRPNVTTFFATGELQAAEQHVAWGEGSEQAGMHLLLGPARPAEGMAEKGQLAALVAAARASHSLVIIDLPALVPGGSPWALEPLAGSDVLVQVTSPTARGVAATVETLATLRDLGTSQRVVIVLVRRAPSAPPARDLVAGVRELWGSCPEIVAEVGFVPALASPAGRGELPTAVPGLVGPVQLLAEGIGLGEE